ncbi:MAG: hypothetical protein LBB23_01570 [Rickettsiales bacterium]|jgi:hypothetical protein|nr:hypothetical protein [Rickettsiales bacterium]
MIRILFALFLLFPFAADAAGTIVPSASSIVPFAGEGVAANAAGVVVNNQSAQPTQNNSPSPLQIPLAQKPALDFPTSADFRANNAPLDVHASLIIVGGLSQVASIIYDNLLDLIIFMIWIFFAFWLGIKAWDLMRTKIQLMPFLESAAKKLIFVVIGTALLASNPAELFMMFMGGVSALGNAASNLFLSDTGVGRVSETCADVAAWVKASGGDIKFLTSQSVGDIICLTGRTTSFFYNGIGTFLGMMTKGVLEAVIGAAGAVVFLWCIFKFAFITLGVVVDVVLMLMFLPFTIFSEIFKGDDWGDTMILSDAMKSFAGIFGGDGISALIQKMIQVVIYIVSISLVAAISFLFMRAVPKDFLNLLIGGALTAYMIYKADVLAKKMGGAVDDKFAKLLEQNTTAIYNNTLKLLKPLITKKKP